VLTRLMTSLLHDVEPTDPLTFALAPVTLTAVAVLAGALPAWRAASLSPVETLKVE
jgi:ABC-type lipoprotein release transport system permease subunit